ncbi:MAG TPA: hypothetical protein VEZ41_10000 [Allosphingosinicella sp.]|nr:hypothetical protein [Allosphingosinicella sp.]
MSKDGTREERLAAALRENLKRRKQQQQRGGSAEDAERDSDGDRSGNEQP